jgi:hypothetical protein
MEAAVVLRSLDLTSSLFHVLQSNLALFARTRAASHAKDLSYWMALKDMLERDVREVSM